MRILITYPGFLLTGAARYAAAMAAELQRRGHDVAVAVHGNGPAAAEFIADPQHRPQLLVVDLPNLRRNARAILQHVVGLTTGTRQIARCINEFKPHVVIGHCVFNMWTALATQLTRVPFVAVIHELPIAFPSLIYRSWQLVLARTAHQLVAVSQEAKLHLPATKTSVIPPGIDTRRFHPGVDGSNLRAQWLGRKSNGHQAPLIVCVSHLMTAKGQSDLLEALPHLKLQMPRFHAVFVGDTNGISANEAFLQRLRTRTHELGLDSAVTFTHGCTDTAVAMAAADVVVYPSHGESFGLVPVEATAVGRRVVATHVGISPHLAALSGAVTLVPPHQPLQIAAAIATACAMPPPTAFVHRQWTIEGSVDALEAKLHAL